MPIISGGQIIPPSTSGVSNPGLRQTIYRTNGVPTDGTIGIPAASIVNGMIAEDLTNNNMYERRAGAWVRMDTL
jgi:hypothetical protein